MEGMNKTINNGTTNVADALRNSAGNIRDEVVGVADEVKGVAQQKFRTLKDESSHQLRRIEGYVKERPLTSLAISLGLGFFAGSLFRRS